MSRTRNVRSVIFEPLARDDAFLAKLGASISCTADETRPLLEVLALLEEWLIDRQEKVKTGAASDEEVQLLREVDDAVEEKRRVSAAQAID